MNCRRISSEVTPKAGSHTANLKKRVMKSFIFAETISWHQNLPDLIWLSKDPYMMNTVLERTVLSIFSLLLLITACFLHILEGMCVLALGLSLCTLS